jgi:hypothetical protein
VLVAVGISVSGFRSNYAGGAQFLMEDGSTRYFRDAIDPRVFVALSTI